MAKGKRKNSSEEDEKDEDMAEDKQVRLALRE